MDFGLFEAVQSALEWFWCYIIESIKDLVDPWIEWILDQIPDLGDIPEYAEASGYAADVIEVFGVFFPMDHFTAAFGFVLAVELLALAFRFVWRSIPGSG